jgi:hypothetical protein
MKVLTFAAGLAAGYLLGTRAGRERVEQIVQGARKVGSYPTVVQVQEKAKDLIGAGVDRPSSTTTAATSLVEPTPAATTTSPRPAARPARTATPGVVTDPLA